MAQSVIAPLPERKRYDKYQKSKHRHNKQTLWTGTYDFAISAPFKLCIVPGCHFTWIRGETLDMHIIESHPDLGVYYTKDAA